MTTVNGRLTNPGATTLPANSAAAAVLVDYDDRPIVGFDVTDQLEILSTLSIPLNADGTWTVALTANSAIQIAGGAAQTAWRITEACAGASDTYWIIVPAGGGPYWVGDLRTTLVGPSLPAPTNLAVAGDLTVGGTLTLDGVALGAPPNDAGHFLASTGAWLVPGGGPPSGAAGGDLTGSTYPNPQLASTTNVHSIIDARIPAALPPSGTASGDLTGSYPAPTLAATPNVNSIVRASRLDQLASPTAAVAMNGQKLTGLATGTASTDAATVGQLPSSPRDPYTAMLGLRCQPYPIDATNNDNLGASSGCLILALNRPGAGPITNLGLWLQVAGTSPGAASMALFPAAGGAQLGVTADMTTALTSSANDDTYVEAPLTTPYTAADGVDYYIGLFTELTADAKIGGIFAESGLHIPTVKGNRPMLVITGLSAMPASLDLSATIAAAAAYWLVGS